MNLPVDAPPPVVHGRNQSDELELVVEQLADITQSPEERGQVGWR